jgi:hypothetical protein
MVSLQLSVADLLRCRFAISPVNEVGEAGRAIANPPALAANSDMPDALRARARACGMSLAG